MKISNTTTKLIWLPRRFNSLGNVSIYDLLKETGYFEIYDKISEDSIREVLMQHPECVDEWISYSEDKRSISGWYLKQEDKDVYVVGYFSGEEDKDIQNKYADRIDACSFFIKHEAEDIRGVHPKNSIRGN